jgi:hypothetical protein
MRLTKSQKPTKCQNAIPAKKPALAAFTLPETLRRSLGRPGRSTRGRGASSGAPSGLPASNCRPRIGSTFFTRQMAIVSPMNSVECDRDSFVSHHLDCADPRFPPLRSAQVRAVVATAASRECRQRCARGEHTS